MAAPATATDLVALIRKSRLMTDDQINAALGAGDLESPDAVIRRLEADGLLTKFQASQLMRGRHKGFVLGKYRLLDRIGMGGMGQVYLAEHTTMQRRVAVKVLPPDRNDNPFARERFLREARAAALLEHQNLVRAFDIELDGDVAFLVMEYVEGVTLHDLVSKRGPLEPHRALSYLWQIACGLSAVHARSLVHRDLKPANVLLDRAGIVRILDLGLVRSELDDDALTRGEGSKIVGTADFLAPEQAMNSSTVDSRADLYSLGCLGYYLLTGAVPFPAERVSQKLLAHQMKVAVPPHQTHPAITQEMSAVIMKLMAKKVADRYQTANELVQDLAPWLNVPIALPEEADFPADREVNSPTGSVSFGISRSGNLNPSQSSGSLSGLSSLSGGGSAIRFGFDSSLTSASPSNQPTANSAAADTMPGKSRVAKPAPMPIPQMTPATGARPINPQPKIAPVPTPNRINPIGDSVSRLVTKPTPNATITPVSKPTPDAAKLFATEPTPNESKSSWSQTVGMIVAALVGISILGAGLWYVMQTPTTEPAPRVAPKR